jgi:hypothetical protein
MGSALARNRLRKTGYDDANPIAVRKEWAQCGIESLFPPRESGLSNLAFKIASSGERIVRTVGICTSAGGQGGPVIIGGSP